MTVLVKEQCVYCGKNVNIGQMFMDCENRNVVTHGKCHKKAGHRIIDDNWFCCKCIEEYTPHYNSFKVLFNEGDDPSSVFIDTLNSLDNINNVLNSCKSYDAMIFNKLPLLEDRQTSSSIFSSYFLNIDGNATNFESFITELHRLKYNNFMVLGLAVTNCTSDNKSL